MSETPSKLRQPRQQAAKVDVESALQDARLDPALLQSLQLHGNAAQPNAAHGPKKRKLQAPSPPRPAGKFGSTLMTAVPRRHAAPGAASAVPLSAAKASILRAKAATAASVRRSASATHDAPADDADSKVSAPARGSFSPV